MNQLYQMMVDMNDRTRRNRLEDQNRQLAMEQQQYQNQLGQQKLEMENQKQQQEMQTALVNKAAEVLMWADTPEKFQQAASWMSQNKPAMYQALGGDQSVQRLLSGDYASNRGMQLASFGKWQEAQKRQMDARPKYSLADLGTGQPGVTQKFAYDPYNPRDMFPVGSEKRPVEKSGMRLSVGPDGTVELVEGTGVSRIEPTTKSRNDLQGDILSAQKTLGELGRVADTHSGEYLTHLGRLKAGVGAFFDKFGMSNDLVTFNANRTKFANNVKQFFNQYRKEITGAAASEKELQQLMESLFNENMGPSEFAAAFNEFTSKVETNLKNKGQTLREGITSAPNRSPRINSGLSAEEQAELEELRKQQGASR